jgi:hypothetical protein
MDKYIDLSALGQVVLASLIVGAGLPALFALGLRGTFQAGGRLTGDGSGSGSSGAVAAPARRRALGVATAVVCFGLVLAAVVGGIVVIVAS